MLRLHSFGLRVFGDPDNPSDDASSTDVTVRDGQGFLHRYRADSGLLLWRESRPLVRRRSESRSWLIARQQ